MLESKRVGKDMGPDHRCQRLWRGEERHRARQKEQTSGAKQRKLKSARTKAKRAASYYDGGSRLAYSRI